jgi:hypothetical protein
VTRADSSSFLRTGCGWSAARQALPSGRPPAQQTNSERLSKPLDAVLNVLNLPVRLLLISLDSVELMRQLEKAFRELR